MLVKFRSAVRRGFAKNGAIDLCCGLHQYATDKRVDLDRLEARRLC